MGKEAMKKYIENYPVNHLSAAYITYMMIGVPQAQEMLEEVLEEREETEDEKVEAEIIRGLSTSDEFFKWMRKELKGNNKFFLRERVVEQEAVVADMIKKRILTSLNDEFIEGSTEFFIKCHENHTEWIMQNYRDIKSPYAQSQLCLVLGFRGDESCEEFLMNQFDVLKNDYPDENFEQGPLIALYVINGLKDELSPE